MSIILRKNIYERLSGESILTLSKVIDQKKNIDSIFNVKRKYVLDSVLALTLFSLRSKVVSKSFKEIINKDPRFLCIYLLQCDNGCVNLGTLKKIGFSVNMIKKFVDSIEGDLTNNIVAFDLDKLVTSVTGMSGTVTDVFNQYGVDVELFVKEYLLKPEYFVYYALYANKYEISEENIFSSKNLIDVYAVHFDFTKEVIAHFNKYIDIDFETSLSVDDLKEVSKYLDSLFLSKTRRGVDDVLDTLVHFSGRKNAIVGMKYRSEFIVATCNYDYGFVDTVLEHMLGKESYKVYCYLKSLEKIILKDKRFDKEEAKDALIGLLKGKDVEKFSEAEDRDLIRIFYLDFLVQRCRSFKENYDDVISSIQEVRKGFTSYPFMEIFFKGESYYVDPLQKELYRSTYRRMSNYFDRIIIDSRRVMSE